MCVECVVPPGAAAMCQTGGEGERGSRQQSKRAEGGGTRLQRERKPAKEK